MGEPSKQQLIQIQTLLVSWPPGKKSPFIEELRQHDRAGALQCVGGMLFGLIFFVPFFGSWRRSHGRVERQVRRLRHRRQLHQGSAEKVTEGTSALFLLSANAVQDKRDG